MWQVLMTLMVVAAPSISIGSSSDVDARRASLRTLLWPTGYPSTRASEEVQVGHVDTFWSTLPNLARVDRLVVHQAHDIDVLAFYFKPATPSGRSIIVHAGHGTFLRAELYRHWVGRFLTYGYDVVLVNMPLGTDWAYPVVNGVTLTNHNLLPPLQTPTLHPISLLLEPTLAALNYLHAQTGRATASMTGLSGGGWTTTLMAALEPRIVKSYPVAGSLPLDVRTTLEIGDYEQSDAELYALASYEDLYIMGSTGSGRGQVQILNEFDGCCFWTANRSPTTFDYVPAVSSRAQQVGGSWQFWVDQGETLHTISDESIDRMLIDQGIVLTTPTRTPSPSPTVTPTRTPTALPTATLRSTATATPQPTVTPVGRGGPCDPRPPVLVHAEAIPGGIRVTATSRSPIVGLVFEQARNATLSPVTYRGPVATFTAHRVAPGPMHMPFTVIDTCGHWPTFVGQGG